MNPKVLCSAALVTVAFAAAAPCQFIMCNPGNRLGLSDGWDSPMQGDGTSFVHTAGIAATMAAGDILTRIENDYMSHWGLDPNDPTCTTKAIIGIELVIQDEDGSTVEPFTIVGYNEDPALPGFPDANPNGSGRFLNTAALMTPGGTPPMQPAAWIFCVTFGPTGTTPVTGILNAQDVFLGAGLDHTAGGFPMNGTSTHAVGNDPMFPPWDEPGRCANLPPPGGMPMGTPRIDQNTYVCRVPTASLGGAPNGAAVYTNDNMNSGYFAQNLIEVHLPASTPGGVAVTKQAVGSNYPAATGQMHFQNAFTSNGTPNGVSGFFPSGAAGDNRGTDDIGFVFFAPPGTPSTKSRWNFSGMNPFLI